MTAKILDLLPVKAGKRRAIARYGLSVAEARTLIEGYGSRLGITYKVEPLDGLDGLAVTVVSAPPSLTDELQKLEKAGDSVTLPHPLDKLATVRAKASVRAKSLGLRSTVRIEDGRMVVALLAAREAPTAVVAAPRGIREPAGLRWSLDALAAGESVSVPLAEEHLIGNLRNYTNYHGPRRGMRWRVTAEPGGHRITRVA